MIVAIRVQAYGVSATASLLTGGASGFPRGAYGFARNLNRLLAKSSMTMGDNIRVGVCVTRLDILRGEENPSTPKMALSQPWNASIRKDGHFNSVENATPLDYEIKANADLTFVILSDAPEGVDTEALELAIRQTVPCMRFTNGSLFYPAYRQKPVPLDRATEAPHRAVVVSLSNTIEDLTETLRQVECHGHFIAAATNDEISSDNPFEDFVEALALIRTKGEDGSVRWSRKHKGWLIPLEYGYQALTNPVTGRPGARDVTVPVIVATPVIGLGLFVPKTSALKDPDLPMFWKTVSDREKGFYLYQPSSLIAA